LPNANEVSKCIKTPTIDLRDILGTTIAGYCYLKENGPNFYYHKYHINYPRTD